MVDIIKKFESMGWTFEKKPWTDRHKNDYYVDVIAKSPRTNKFFVCEESNLTEELLLLREMENIK